MVYVKVFGMLRAGWMDGRVGTEKGDPCDSGLRSGRSTAAAPPELFFDQVLLSR